MEEAGVGLSLSVIVPFHRRLDQLRRCLAAVDVACRALPADVTVAEIIVAADGAVDDPHELAAAHGARVVEIPGPRGPAVARNRGVDAASGELIVFVDTDVVMHDDALARFAALFTGPDAPAAAFGAYDETPAEPNFFSQVRNLAHAYIHQRSNPEAHTFWAGLGAVRRQAFIDVGGFDERFPRPSVEDIELGYRLNRAGHRIRLDPAIQGTHLKRWTLWSSVMTDLRDRGVPWTQLLARYAAMRSDLNLTLKYRMCVVLAYLLCGVLLLSWWWPWLLALAAALLGLLWWLDRDYYGFFARRRGVGTALAWFPFHVLHHLTNGVSFAVGNALYVLRRVLGVSLPWTLPVTPWKGPGASSR